MKRDEITLKFCIIGSNDNLNTQFARLTSDSHLDDSTTGVDISAKRIYSNKGFPINLKMWMPSGRKVYRNIRPMYLEGSSCCIIIFDKQEEDYESEIIHWVKEGKTAIHSSTIVIVGIKLNKDEEIDLEAKKLAKQLNAIYYETTITDKEMINQILSETGSSYVASLFNREKSL